MSLSPPKGDCQISHSDPSRTIEQEFGSAWADNAHPDGLQNCLKTYVEAFDAREPFVVQIKC
jgi:hypothetical protein